MEKSGKEKATKKRNGTNIQIWTGEPFRIEDINSLVSRLNIKMFFEIFDNQLLVEVFIA
jgi:hypothetical protein